MNQRCLAVVPIVLSLWGCKGPDSDLPRDYRRIAVPVDRLAQSEALERGRALFVEHCALCHGEKADGHGVRRNLSSRPVDLTDPLWRDRTTPRRVFFVIREGVRGTPMAGWKILDETETWDLVAYVMSVAETPPQR